MLHKALTAAEVETEVKARKHKPRMCEPEPCYRASSTLLSRLAEAVDGNRNAEPVVYIAEHFYHPLEKGHEVHGPFKDCETACTVRKEEFKDPEGKKYGIFGPFWTSKATSGTIAKDGKGPRVKKVVVHLDNRQTITLKPDDADAVFWSRAAVEKFVIPYYVGIGSLTEGTTILDSKGVALVHRPGSEWRTETSRILIDGKPLEKDPGIGTVVICVDPSEGSKYEEIMAVPLV
jgi:hypothetical protein